MPRLSEVRNNDWKLSSNGDGTYVMDRVLGFLLGDIRTELQGMRSELQGMRSEINTIRHFFHQPGMASAVRALITKANRDHQRQLARRRAARRRRAALVKLHNGHV